MNFESLTDFLTKLAGMDDGDVPLADSALVLSAADMPEVSTERYRHYLAQLGPRVRANHHDLIGVGADDNAQTQIAALKNVLVLEDGYTGDVETYDLLDNANLMRVIDRRRGMPITLGILYIHAGQAAGFDIDGINFPGHFLLRMSKNGVRVIFDPFEGCRIMDAPDLRALLKKVNGPAAELMATYYETASARDILVRVQNNIKLRQIEAEDYAAAVRTVERMRQIHPTEFRLLLDAGVLYAKLGQYVTAVPLLEGYIDALPAHHPHRADAEILLSEICAT